MPLITQHTRMLSCWMGFGRHVTLSQRSQATLLPLSWTLLTLCQAQQSCSLSLAPAKQMRWSKMVSSHLLCLSTEEYALVLATKPGNNLEMFIFISINPEMEFKGFIS